MTEAAEVPMGQTIILQTTPGDQIPGHFAVNARCRVCNRILTYERWPEDDPTPRCECDEPVQLPVFGQEGQYAGKTVAICGAGPSLNDAYRTIRKAHHVWGANRAANFLVAKNWRVTHAFGIDAGSGMYEDCWKDPPPVSEEYILASSVHPLLTDQILAAGQKVRFFHSARGGIKDEYKLMGAFFPPSPIVGQGLNSVNRAVELAYWLGYKKISVCGADNAFRDGKFYADGSQKIDHGDGAMYLTGKVFGRKWRTTPDMLMSACGLARMKWGYGPVMELVGDTLPRALSRTSDEFLDNCIRWASADETRAAREELGLDPPAESERFESELPE